jgi:hypothetical protein
MTGDGLGPQATDLLREAHRDVPSHARRAQMWEGIEAGVVAGGTVAAAGTVKALSGLTKVLLGVVIGGALVAGLTASLVPPKLNDDLSMVGNPSQPVMVVRKVVEAPAVVMGGGLATTGTDLELGNDDLARSGNADSLANGNNGLASSSGGAPSKGALANSGSPTNGTHGANVNASRGTSGANASAHEDPLVREARLVAEARGALLRGDPSQALKILKVARSTPNPGLEPEELALQARALRDLGANAEADAVEKDLARRFPENALGR